MKTFDKAKQLESELFAEREAHKQTSRQGNATADGLYAELAAAKAQIAALHERLEDNFAYLNGERVEVEIGSIPDGIACRDEAIKLQDEKLAALEAKRKIDIQKCERIIIDGISGEDALEAIRAAFPEVFK